MFSLQSSLRSTYLGKQVFCSLLTSWLFQTENAHSEEDSSSDGVPSSRFPLVTHVVLSCVVMLVLVGPTEAHVLSANSD